MAFLLIAVDAYGQQRDNYRSLLSDQHVRITETNLPIIFITVDGQMILRDRYVLGHMKVIHNGDGQLNYGDTIDHPGQHIDYEGPIAIKYRGNSSFDSADKKPYQIRTLKSDLLPDDGGEKQKVSILGMPKDNKWMFIAPWGDKVMFRDILSFELARPWMDFVPTVKLCEVFLDGIYYGVFGFGERVSKGKGRLDLHNPRADEGDPNPDGSEAITGLGNINRETNAFNSGTCHSGMFDVSIFADSSKEILGISMVSMNSAFPTILAFAYQVVGPPSAITVNEQTTDAQPAGIYDMQGRRQEELRPGVNIIRKDDGSVRKVLVR